MICDHVGCKIEPMRAPRVVVPAVEYLSPEHTPLKMMMTLHYCERHKGEVAIGDVLNAKVRRDFEQLAKRIRPLGYKCDFEAAFIEYVLVTTPEYRQWMSRINIAKLVRAA